MIAVALVVACGVVTFVSMVSVYNSLRATRATYYDRYRFADLFANMKRAPESLTREIEGIPGVESFRTRVVMEVTLDVPGLDEPATGRLISIPEHKTPMINDLYIRRGGYIEPGRSDQVIISEAFAQANKLDPGDILGAVINGRWRELRIVGVALSPEYVYELGAVSLLPDNRRFGILWMGRDGLASAFSMEGAFNDLSIRLSPEAREREVIDRIDKVIERYGGLGAYGRNDQISARFLSDELAQLKGNALYVPVIFLGVAAFLLHIVLSRLVGTQRDQVAVLKAFGYSNIAVGIHYMKFAMVPVLLGAFLGTLGGMWLGGALTEVYTQFYRFPILRYEAGVDVVALAVMISGGAAVVGAIGAVRRAVGLPPAEAMRPEPPARFKPGLMEKIGLQRLFSASGRMVIRSVERNPWKSLISIVGIAFSIAILVVGRFSFDAIDFIINLQFRTVQREDVTVVFNLPRPTEARYDLTHLPGVIRAEVFRSVPVRLRNGHRSRRLGLQGMEPHGELRRIIDQSFHEYTIPADGLVLSQKLGEVLGIALGDTLTVEVLEGSRPVRRMVVTGLVDEVLGTAAYVDLEALNRMMGEGGTISGAHLAIDEAEEDRLYEELKRTPAVAGTAVRKTAIESFESTIAQSQGISGMVVVILASVIAFGIIYNSARIALSERGRELASLRVLGFTNREIAVMLFGEQLLLTLAAIPVGFAIGYLIVMMLVAALSSELYRFPLIISGSTYAYAAIVVTVASILSGLLVRRRLYNLDLIEVLKTRE